MTHKETAYAQIGLTVLFIVGYFIVLIMFMAGYVRVPTDFKDAFTALLGVITASVVSILNYWFARQRPDSPGNPPVTSQ
jgi:uncharacterized BrkB/YihY/UPF0761 family membrane protein